MIFVFCRQREISVEEGVGLIHFDLVRSQGLEGQVTVDITTEPGTAQTTADVTAVSLVPMEVCVYKMIFLALLCGGIIAALLSSVLSVKNI